MIIYIIKSSACLLIFGLLYRFFLERESWHLFKRAYLIMAVMISFIIPLITFDQYVEFNPLIAENSISNSLVGNTAPSLFDQAWSFEVPVLWAIYLTGLVIFGLRFMLNFSKLMRKIIKNPKFHFPGFTHVLISKHITPHTFLRYIFLNRSKYIAGKIPEEILVHEQAHARQLHAIDILFIELIQVVFWFNPLIKLFKNHIKLNHEFLADKAVIETGVDFKEYKALLLTYSTKVDYNQLSNAINYSLIKKRFTIMKTNSSGKFGRVKFLVLLPITAMMIYGFSGRNQIETFPEKFDSADSFMDEGQIEASIQDPKITEFKTQAEVVEKQQQSATREEMKEYNALAKKYNNMPKDDLVVKVEDVKRMKYIYQKMSDKQRKSAEPFPKLPEPPVGKVKKKDGKTQAVLAKEKYEKAKLARVEEMKKREAVIAAEAKYKKAKLKSEKAVLAEEKEINRAEKALREAEERRAYDEVRVRKLKAEKIKFEKAKAAHVKAKEVRATEMKMRKEEMKARKIKEEKAVKPRVKVKTDSMPMAKLPPPPPPESKDAQLKNMSVKNASFYYEGKLVSSQQASQIIKLNPEIKLVSKDISSDSPVVILTRITAKLRKKQ